jgi:3-hydroxybutyryl-CoA dehydratase
VKIGDEITARAEVVEMISEKRMRLRTQCFNQRKEMVIDGETIMIPPRPGRTIKGAN